MLAAPPLPALRQHHLLLLLCGRTDGPLLRRVEVLIALTDLLLRPPVRSPARPSPLLARPAATGRCRPSLATSLYLPLCRHKAADGRTDGRTPVAPSCGDSSGQMSHNSKGFYVSRVLLDRHDRVRRRKVDESQVVPIKKQPPSPPPAPARPTDDKW